MVFVMARALILSVLEGGDFQRFFIMARALILSALKRSDLWFL